ncbi:MAG TPA: T9SS type A sorting domain-containing protein, partial [Candidatus Kapabacteria bacterium]|nr:T9SS type A sorting domain-containing protein [Candidatus Kapabacteria bacterium]
KVYMIASLSPATGASRERFQFTTFDLNASAGTATWSGAWKNGPGDDQISIEAGGQMAIQTSESGKIGIVWVPSVNNGENVHFSESTDGGNTWSNATIPVYERTEAMAQDQNGELTGTDPTSWMTPVDGLDLMYVGDVANVVWSAHAQTEVNDDGSYTYYPSIGAIMHWRQGGQPASLISRREWSLDYEHKVLMEALSFFPIGIGTNPQGDVHLEHSTIARTGDPNKWSVIFNAWIEADTSESFLYDRGGEEFDQSFTYRSLWMITTLDGGQNWSDPEMIRGDDPESFEEPALDFRFPQVSTWNPIVANQAFYQILFTVDTLPGIWEIGGQPIWGNVSYFAERVPGPTGVNSVKRIGTTENLTLDQNYPNPFNPSTSVSFSVKETAQVRLVVEDMMGREVATIFEGVVSPGQSQKVKFDASDLTSGIYQYVLKTENESVARRMVLTK